jgi:cell shape-determining protein MreC
MIELTKIQYETLWETIEVLQKDKLHMQKLHGELIDKIITLNTIIFDRTNDVNHLYEENKRLKLENVTLQPVFSRRELDNKIEELQKENSRLKEQLNFSKAINYYKGDE